MHYLLNKWNCYNITMLRGSNVKKFFRTISRPPYWYCVGQSYSWSDLCVISVRWCLIYRLGYTERGAAWDSISVSGLYWEIQMEVCWCAEPLSYPARQTSTLTDRRPHSPKQSIRDRQILPATRAKAATLTLWIVPNWHFSTALNWRFSVFSLSCKANATL